MIGIINYRLTDARHRRRPGRRWSDRIGRSTEIISGGGRS
jgi:hypothetical protein